MKCLTAFSILLYFALSLVLFIFRMLRLFIFKIISKNFSSFDVTKLPIDHCLNIKYYLSPRRLESVLNVKDAARNSIHS